jgi:hypothetical protein
MSWTFLRNVVVKALVLFLLFNLAFAAWNPRGLGRVSAYNALFPGRERLPFGENPQQAYNLSLFDMEAMFASHTVDGKPKPAGEYRVVLIGDSSVWGTLLRPEETLAGQIDGLGLRCGSRMVRAYNLGYPTISITKDLMILDRALRYQPDLIIWLVTLEALPVSKQLSSPIVANNLHIIEALEQKYRLGLDVDPPLLAGDDLWQRTLLSRQRALADLVRLQVYGVMWAATGIDQVYPTEYEKAAWDLEPDATYQDLPPGSPLEGDLALNVLQAGLSAAGVIPVLLVNEPVLISQGENSHLRYNFYYPRWAYDTYREIMSRAAQTNGWFYLDAWDAVPAGEFTNSAIHLTPEGESVLAGLVAGRLQELCR